MATAAERMTQIWEAPPGIASWFATVDHKSVGRRYIFTAFFFFGLAGLDALAIRTQLIVPNAGVMSPETYNQLFTMHGITMIFLFAVPVLIGLGNYLVPLMLGAREVAFPRVNAFSYWVFLFSGLFLWCSFLFGAAPDAGWFNYVPLSNVQFNTGANIDFYALGLIFLGISTTASSINFIVTIFKLRAPGMSVNRMPLFVWGILIISFILLFAIPPLNVANLLLILDRRVGTHFYEPAHGGNVLLWQHLFWTFGHPEVYIVFLPAAEIISTTVSTFSRRPIVAYILLVLAVTSTGFLSFGVWVHHMFAVGLPPVSLTFFSAASMTISIPSGIQVFAWITTIFKGRTVIKTPLLFSAGFIVVFVIGGVSGVMFAAVPFDQQTTDSYFVVAHLHYVIAAAAIFPVFSGIHYWFPKITGRMYVERLGALTFWLMFIGFNLVFFPMHILGLLGMPRRVYTYSPGMGWAIPNLISSIGAYILGAAVLVFLANMLYSWRSGEIAGDNPWNAGTLEWATSSPPPPYNFLTIPEVHSRDPLWDQTALAPGPASGQLVQPGDGRRETLGTTIFDSDPQEVLQMPKESTWPLVVAVGLLVLFIGIIGPYLLVSLLGLATFIVGILGWLWPVGEMQA